MKYNIASTNNKKQAEVGTIRGKSKFAQDFHHLIKIYW